MKLYTVAEVARLTDDITVTLAVPDETLFRFQEVDVASLEVGLVDADGDQEERLRVIRELTCWTPIVVWAGVVIDGNHRTTIALERGWRKLAAFVAVS